MQHSTMALLAGVVLMAVVLQTSAQQCSYRRDFDSAERFGCRGLREGGYFLDDNDGCGDEFFQCKNSRLTKYECSRGCVFDEASASCVPRRTVRACDFD